MRRVDVGARRPALVFAVAVIGGLLATLAVPRSARCDDEGEGRRRFKAGTELYRKGRFLEAAEEFEAGYRAAPRPLFLLNIGHSYRRGGELRKAREAYKKLLEVEPTLPQRAEVEGYLRNIDDALSVAEIPVAPPPRNGNAANAPPPPPRVPDLQPQPSSGTDETPLPVFVEHGASSDAPPDEPSRSVASRPWFWAVVVGALVAGGVAAALLLKSDNRCPADACFRESR